MLPKRNIISGMAAPSRHEHSVPISIRVLSSPSAKRNCITNIILLPRKNSLNISHYVVDIANNIICVIPETFALYMLLIRFSSSKTFQMSVISCYQICHLQVNDMCMKHNFTYNNDSCVVPIQNYYKHILSSSK